jgi:hypothetical protein
LQHDTIASPETTWLQSLSLPSWSPGLIESPT